MADETTRLVRTDSKPAVPYVEAADGAAAAPALDVDSNLDLATAADADESPSARPPTPLPGLQLFIVLFVRLTEPIGFAVIFPFINQELVELGVVADATQTGFYAGVIESTFALAELLTVFYWGSLSDRIGRRPVLLIGCAASAVSATCFGLSKSFTTLLVARAINGLANGNVAVLKSVIGEITDETNQARAFSFFPLALAIGNILASLIGGYLPHPARYAPRLVAVLPFLADYPYFLPCFAAALFPLTSGVLAWMLLRESLPADLHAEPAADVRAMLADAHVRALLVSFTALSLAAIALGSLLPLFLFTPLAAGGLGFSEAQIGTALSVRGAATIAVQLFAFPRLVRQVGTVRLFNVLVALYLPTFLGLPLTHALAPLGSAWIWAGVTAVVALASVGNMAFACNLILTNNAAPSRRSLGALNGLAAALASLSRVIGPASTNALFAYSIEQRPPANMAVWVALSALAVACLWSGLRLRRFEKS
ncbi:hypothetical protein Q5752_005884 [Cryptotrichosporon argae]